MESLDIVIIAYYLIVLGVCVEILVNTYTPSKTLAYIFLVFFLPVGGILFYLSVGVNYRKRSLYNKKLRFDKVAFPEFERQVHEFSHEVLARKQNEIDYYYPLATHIAAENLSSLKNEMVPLINGEKKFPELISSLKSAKHHIHIEYYIYEDDSIGTEIADILMDKARQGIEVRFIYDDFGSSSIRKSFIKRLQTAGVQAFPFYKIRSFWFANRMNYRNHRKIVIIDGIHGFVGGINVSDRYINNGNNKRYWRDTHLKIMGEAVMQLQYVFLTDWNFCSNQKIAFSPTYFPAIVPLELKGDKLVQMVAAGPDSDHSSILYTMVQAIVLSRKEVLLTTPYFIPDKSLLDVLKIAAFSAVKIRLLVPGISDSIFVNAASSSYYEELLEAGVEIYRYNKGFVHAKTIVCDRYLSFVGTTNLDHRSFDLNFEINALVYDHEIAASLASSFEEDLENSEQLTLADWQNRPLHIKIFERLMRLFSSLM